MKMRILTNERMDMNTQAFGFALFTLFTAAALYVAAYAIYMVVKTKVMTAKKTAIAIVIVSVSAIEWCAYWLLCR